MKSLTYNRPYQYVEDLRLFACYRSKEHAVFVGQGFADNAVAFIENGPMLTKLEQQGKVVHGDFDQLITQSFDVAMPFRIYVVNPDDENGKASNAIEYTASSDTPVLDVKVDGKSVVKDQIAIIDLTGKLDVIMKPNKIYGTDADGREAQFDRQQIEGVQHFFLNGEEIPVDMGNVRLIDIAKESKTVQRVSTPLQIYGTNQDGEQATYPRDFFATSSSVDDATKEIQALSENKQDKDKSAKDGYLAIMKNGQSVGSNGNLDDIMNNIMTVQQNLDKLTQKIDKGFIKDWKALSGSDSSILNNPIGDNSIVITDKPIADEKAIRDTSNAVVYGLQPDKISDFGTAMGTRNATGNYGVAMGAIATAKGDSAVAVGSLATATGDNSTSIGKNSSVTGKGSVALGFNSFADVDNTVSVGYDTTDTTKTPTYRRITAVDTPVNPHDAANKSYVDSNGGISEYNKTFEPMSNPYFLQSIGNPDRWKMSNTYWNEPLSEALALRSIYNLNELDKYGVLYPDTWTADSVGVIELHASSMIEDRSVLESKGIRILDDDKYHLSFYAGTQRTSVNVQFFSINVRVSLKSKSGDDISISLGSPSYKDLMGDMKYFEYEFSLENLIKSHQEVKYPLDMRIDIMLTSSHSQGRLFVTGLRLRNLPNAGTPKFLNSASPIVNKFLDTSVGNIDGWRYSTGGQGGTWKDAIIMPCSNVELAITNPGENLKNGTGLLMANDREAWLIAHEFNPVGYSKYYFSCLLALPYGFPKNATPTAEFGFGILDTNDNLVKFTTNADSLTVGPVDITNDGFFTKISGTVAQNIRDWSSGIVPMIHIVNPASDATESTRVYVTNIKVERTSLESPTVAQPTFPYIVGGGTKAVKVNDIVYLSVNGKFDNFTADVVEGSNYPHPIEESLKPGKGTGGAVMNCIEFDGSKVSQFFIRIDEDGKMYATGHIAPYARIYGSVAYPVGDFSKPYVSSPNLKSLPISSQPSDSQHDDNDSDLNANASSKAVSSSNANGSTVQNNNNQESTENPKDSTDKSDDAQTTQQSSNETTTNEDTTTDKQQ